jgi:uncharacterized protein YvpB
MWIGPAHGGRQSSLSPGCRTVDCVGCRALSGIVLAFIAMAFEAVLLQDGQVDVLAVAGLTHVAHDSVTPNAVTTPAPPPPASPDAPPARILAVPWYQQAYELSCEEASLRMALAHESISTTDAIIINIIGIDTRSATFDHGAMRWGDPYVTFVGDPNGSETGVTGYGTYYPTIARAAVTLGGQVLSAGEGIAPAAVYDAILHGHPVVAWVTYGWVTTVRDDYVAFDGRPVPYAGPVEHAVTVVGVNEASVLVNNPISGPEWVSKSTFEAAYSTYQQMAVVLA